MGIRSKGCYSLIDNGDETITLVRVLDGQVYKISDDIPPGKLEDTIKNIEKKFANQKTHKTQEEYLDFLAKQEKRRLDTIGIRGNNQKYLDKKGWKLKETSGGAENIDIIDDAGRVLYRGNKNYIEKYIKFSKLPISKQKKLTREMYDIIADNSKKYNKTKSSKKLKKIGYDTEIPATKGGPGKGNGVAPDLSVLGDNMFMKNGKLGNGTYTKIEGFSVADVENALQKIRSNKGTIRTNVTGNRTSDFANCWKDLGIDPRLGTEINSKLELTWHHLDDLGIDMKSSFQLSIKNLHRKTTPHVGSHKQIEVLLDLIS